MSFRLPTSAALSLDASFGRFFAAMPADSLGMTNLASTYRQKESETEERKKSESFARTLLSERITEHNTTQEEAEDTTVNWQVRRSHTSEGLSRKAAIGAKRPRFPPRDLQEEP
jgi:hypothetical protein